MGGAEELTILTYPDPVLRVRAEEITNIDEGLIDLAESMIFTMYRAPGIGLAANQVGALKRIIVFDRSPAKPGASPQILINPEIVAREGKIVHDEACLSVTDFSAEVTRSDKVRVKGIDGDGKQIEIDAEGLLSVCLQHEIDHLDGILYIDHISSLKRALYKRKLKKILSGD
ncbi:MAG: peptide deformylase [Desulfobacteraceae bacterium]|jgi:peptide deformylase|nr:MAG: peptide deformylase [Desulfobacteraceae bacterium]